MLSPNSVSIDTLASLVGTPNAPTVIDVRNEEDFARDPRLIPGSIRRAATQFGAWAATCTPHPTVVVCQEGHKLSEGVAAWMRQSGVPAKIASGGFVAWAQAGLPLVPVAKLPSRQVLPSHQVIPSRQDGEGSLWVTRARPKIDRIACPWLIRRFVDPAAVFLFVAPAEVAGVGEKFNATPFDVDGVFWSHRDELCTFDVMVDEFGLASAPLLHLATMVRAADTARLDLCPEAAGLLAASLGLSAMFEDDLAQLEAGMLLYDALYSWCRNARAETHNWPSRTEAAA